MNRGGFHYNFEPYRFRSAWNNAHEPSEQETYFEILAARPDVSYDMDTVEDAVLRIAPHAYVSEESHALEPCVVIPRKEEHLILELVEKLKNMGWKCRFPTK